MWTQEIPTKSGYYWFLGWPYGKDDTLPNPMIVQVMHGLLVIDNAFVSSDSALAGWFTKVQPTPPLTRDMADWFLKIAPELIYGPRDRG